MHTPTDYFCRPAEHSQQQTAVLLRHGELHMACIPYMYMEEGMLEVHDYSCKCRIQWSVWERCRVHFMFTV